MATAVEASDVAMRYVTEVERCPPPHQNIACGYCELFPWSLKLNTHHPSTGKIKNECSFDFIALLYLHYHTAALVALVFIVKLQECVHCCYASIWSSLCQVLKRGGGR